MLALGAVVASASASQLVAILAVVVLLEVFVVKLHRRKPVVLSAVVETLGRLRIVTVLVTVSLHLSLLTFL